LKHHFLDRYSDADGPLHGVDPRIKILAILMLVACAVTTPPRAQAAFAVYGALVAAAVVASRVPVLHFVKSLAAVLPFAVAIAAFLPFMPKAGDAVGLGPLVLSQTGLWRFAAAVEKSLLGVSCAVLLVSTTRFPKLLSALAGLGLPRPFVTMLSFAYRYAFVTTDELERMLRARRARLSEAGMKVRYGSLGQLAGTLFVRSYERAERIYAAMVARGWSGTPPRQPSPRLAAADLALFCAASGAAVAARVFLR